MESWSNLYLEMAGILSADLTDDEFEIYGNLNTIIGSEKKTPLHWIDLWYNQVNFLSEELNFPAPAVFLSFRTKNITDLSEKVQQIILQIDCFFFYETLANSFAGSYNQEDAIKFLKVMDFINGRFHGTSGNNYNNMRKVGFNPEDIGGSGNLYKIVFECIIRDESAAGIQEEGTFSGMEIETSYQTLI
ncbi:hypothetical protein [Chryseobacterium sp.]|uniref:hypothetical protein n=1 Tax=Chryseobacterium sp. TaxID=1871047 RepID=UPI0028965D72|nr:hypothetical protein [Chryseobacterium sp.]